MTRLRLLKLLYIADRESISETEAPITGDTVAALDHGPVLSETYNLIKGEAFDALTWNRYFRSANEDVILREDPGVDRLSRYTVRKLREVAQRYAELSTYDLVRLTHGFQEWLDNEPEQGGSRRISLASILTALGMEDRIEEIEAEDRASRTLDRAVNLAMR